jgi:hypothetical protein
VPKRPVDLVVHAPDDLCEGRVVGVDLVGEIEQWAHDMGHLSAVGEKRKDRLNIMEGVVAAPYLCVRARAYDVTTREACQKMGAPRRNTTTPHTDDESCGSAAKVALW